jgi:hypothetical protein
MRFVWCFVSLVYALCLVLCFASVCALFGALFRPLAQNAHQPDWSDTSRLVAFTLADGRGGAAPHSRA